MRLTRPLPSPLTVSPLGSVAQSYVRLTSYPCHTHDAGVRVFSEKATAAKPSDFVESLAYSFETSVVMTGDMIDEVRSSVHWALLPSWHLSSRGSRLRVT